MENINLNK
ncbi:hypothetical protein Mgra_00009241 [Meloidogyne graminicola]|uniref:Uncharacterized protein n=1 Tax=Meloidogyne graminicola TaxID=189291 RepID=A0A8S9ZDL1_9BILA|nr:hypothetical protein Mgra_00009241 [Meloidogyne graminicola]